MTDEFQRLPSDLLRHFFEFYVREPCLLIVAQFVCKRFKKAVEAAVNRERQRTYDPQLRGSFRLNVLTAACARDWCLLIDFFLTRLRFPPRFRGESLFEVAQQGNVT